MAMSKPAVLAGAGSSGGLSELNSKRRKSSLYYSNLIFLRPKLLFKTSSHANKPKNQVLSQAHFATWNSGFQSFDR